MDRYFYSIELDGNEKVIHFNGNIYFNDGDESETDHRIAEWTGLYITIEELSSFLDKDSLFEYINERVNYLGDITKGQAEEMCKAFYDGDSGVELDVKCVTEDTPCGNYWF